MNFNLDPIEYRNTNSIARIRKSLQLRNAEESENLEAIKDDTKDIVSLGIAKFKENMEMGKIDVSSVADLERLVKLGLLVEGSATEITQDNSQSAVIEMSSSEFEELSESEEFIALREKLAANLNNENQEKLNK